MGAGHGIVHSEFNASETDDVHLLQIWILPSQRGLAPKYEQRSVRAALESGVWTRLLRSENAEPNISKAFEAGGAKVASEQALTPRQAIELWAKRSQAHEALSWKTSRPQTYWLQLIQGELRVEGQDLKAGDALAIEDAINVNLVSKTESEFILFVF
jgi:redox-sensitive bicupin YhaK (pirin superfamily)